MTNTITSPGEAIVNGKPTGLSGCARSAECPAADTCLRADARLVYRDLVPEGDMPCRFFIPTERSEP
jgi:hypothetical protein